MNHTVMRYPLMMSVKKNYKGEPYGDPYASAMRHHGYLSHESPGVPAKINGQSALEKPTKPIGYVNDNKIHTSATSTSTMAPHGYLAQEIPDALVENNTFVKDDARKTEGHTDDNVNTSAVNHEQFYGINYDPAAAIA